MEGILKSAPKPEQKVEKKIPKVTSGIDVSPTIHQEFLSYFGVKGGNEQVKYVSEWAMGNAEDVGHALKALKSVEVKVGIPSGNETRLSKVYNYLRMTNRLTDRENELADELGKIVDKNKQSLAEIKEMFDGKQSKIKEELEKVKMSYLQAKSRFNRDASSQSMAVRNEYQKHINELKAMRDAYKG